MSDRLSFFLYDSEHNCKVKCNILFSFDSYITGNSYLVYTDGTMDDEGNINVYASRYETESLDDDFVLQPIETEQEWEIIETILDNLQRGIREGIPKEEIQTMIEDALQRDLPECDN